MLLCLTTLFITGFQSCQKETPQLIEATHELDQIETFNRIGDQADIVYPELEETCDCCIRILDIDVDADEGHYTLQFQGGYNGIGSPCTLEGTNLDCPFFQLQHGDCRDIIWNQGLCTTAVNANDSDRCYNFDCTAEAGNFLFFSASLQLVNPVDCSIINVSGIDATITFEIVCQSNDVRCYPDIAVDQGDDDNIGDDPNPTPTVTTVTTSSTIGTINLSNFGQGFSQGSETLELLTGECCEAIF